MMPLMRDNTTIGVGLIGCGTVGQGVVRLLEQQGDLYARRLGRSLVLRRVLVRDPEKSGRTDLLDRSLMTADPEAFASTADMPIVVEVAGGLVPVGSYVHEALAAGKHVVTANKSLLAARGAELFALARRHNVSIAFEASCGGGIPIVNALLFGISSNRVDAMYGILNGTCNYILTEMTRSGTPYGEALGQAQEMGFAEADPTLDVSGRDAAEKLAILTSLAFGAQTDPADVACEGIDKLELDDIRFGAELGYEIKLLGIAERGRGEAPGSGPGPGPGPVGPESSVSMRVHPCFVPKQVPLAQVHGTFNALAVYGHALGYCMYLGRGAGQMPTASAVVADLLNVASGWYPQAFSHLTQWPDQHGPAELIASDDLVSRFYLRFSARDEPGVVARVSKVLGDAGISLGALLQHEVAAGQFVPLVIITHEAHQGALIGALAAIEKLPVIEGTPVCLRSVDMPEG